MNFTSKEEAVPISLSKGGNISLSKAAPGLTKVTVGLGWDVRQTDGAAFDLDGSVYLCGASGTVRGDGDFVFYNQLKSGDGSVEHLGDNKTGAGEGDDENVRINLAAVPADVDKIAVGVTIHEAAQRGQNFGMVRNAFIRVVNDDSGEELARYDLSEDASVETSMVFGEVYRNGGEWKFRAVGQGFQGGLDAMAKSFGVTL